MADPKKIEIVQRGVNAYAKIELALEEIYAGLQELECVYRDGGAAKMTGATEVLRTVNHLRTLSGKTAAVAKEIYELHERATEIAKKNEADVALPDDYVVLLGGGGR